MIRFLQFIKEGGNIEINGIRPKPIEAKNRSTISNDLHSALGELNNSFQANHGHNLFGNALEDRSAYAGSTAHFMNPNLSDEEYGQHKPRTGDVDVQVNENHREKLNDHLEQAQKAGTRFGNFTIVGTRRTGSQTHALMKHDNGDIHQVDFEPVEYDEKTQKPSEWSQFSHNSHWDDIKNGVKGAFHKYLLQSTTAAKKTPSLVSVTTGRGKNKQDTVEERNIEPNSVSVDRGVRARYKQVGMDGYRPIMKEIPPSEAEYSRKLPDVYKTLFNRDASPQDINDIHSFGGIAEHIKRHIPKDQQAHIVKKFVDKLWGGGAQALDRDEKEDQKAKDNAYNALRSHFPEHINHEEVQNMRGAYYDPKNPKPKFEYQKTKATPNDNTEIQTESEKEDFHIAAGIGRFNGPSEEHHKLIENIMSQKAHKHYVFVMGPESKEKTSDKDPMTAEEKVEHLKRLYPEYADSFIAGVHRHVKNPHKAITWMWHQHQQPNRNVNLTLVAGSGEEGVDKKSAAGGSAENYRSILEKGNGSRFPRTENPDGTVRGGDYKFNYASHNVVEQPRGKTSGSVLRKLARTHDYNNPEHVKKFMAIASPRFKEDHAREVMKAIKERSSVSESLLVRLKEILEL